MKQQAIDELFARTVAGDYGDESAWEAIHTLRRLGTREVFDKAASWCASPDPLLRSRGIDVLAQLGNTAEHPTNSFIRESYSLISGLLLREQNDLPLSAAISALGHLENSDAVPLVASFHSHPNPEVRFSVAFSLGCFPNQDLSVEILLELVEDSDNEVRDWAVFVLGVLGDRDSPAIREALYRCLNDLDEDVREEAMVGLGKRKDLRVMPVLVSALSGTEVKVRVAEAASNLLGLDKDPDEWGAPEYLAALSAKFSEQ